MQKGGKLKMYISEFWCGVFATILTELSIIIGYRVWIGIKNKDKNK